MTTMDVAPQKSPTEARVEVHDEEREAVEDKDLPRLKDERPQTASVRRVPSTISVHDNVISLHEVAPVSVRLEHLSVSVDESPNAFATLFSKKKTPPSHSHVKAILDDISA